MSHRAGCALVQGSVLLLSQRRIADLVAYCVAYEFEDVVAAVTGARRIDVVGERNLEFSRRVYKLARALSGRSTFASRIAPHPREKAVLDRDYELFFPIFSHSYELYSLAFVPNWRERCRKAACFIAEAQLDPMPVYLLELLSQFDHIFVGLRQGVGKISQITGRPCTYLPYAVDVPRFIPSSSGQQRPIAVCNIGRRSQITHQALLEDAQRRQSFYYYDTVAASGADRRHRTFRVDSPREHRLMLATLLKHSHYFFAHRSYVNIPEITRRHDEISGRFYEGAAAGTVMIGEAPKTDEFKQQFDWPDAVIHVPFDSPDICRILEGLDMEPKRMLAARRNNVREAALRHDWLHRIQVVFETLGLEPTDEMRERARRLDRIASQA